MTKIEGRVSRLGAGASYNINYSIFHLMLMNLSGKLMTRCENVTISVKFLTSIPFVCFKHIFVFRVNHIYFISHIYI